jgi:hypothetical protein
MASNVAEADWQTRREVIRALVRPIEIGEQQGCIVERVPPVPLVERPEGGVLQECGRVPPRYRILCNLSTDPISSEGVAPPTKTSPGCNLSAAAILF